jgi:hypothetical protein
MVDHFGKMGCELGTLVADGLHLKMTPVSEAAE